jgi:hypothetical protein
MKPISFPQQTVVFAKDQPEYLPLPAHVDAEGVVTFCWQLSWRDRLRMLVTGKLWHQVLTFHRPLQPQRPSSQSPFIEFLPKAEERK